MKTVGEIFKELKASLENNMRHVYRDAGTGKDQAGHYPAAVLIVVGSEALSRLQGKENDDDVFVDMMGRHNIEPPLARKLFDALRNGLAHIWDTNILDTGTERVELIVSWREKKHLSLRSEPSASLNLNVESMWRDLDRALLDYEKELQSDPRKAMDRPPSRWSRKLVTSLTESRPALEAWERFRPTAHKEDDA